MDKELAIMCKVDFVKSIIDKVHENVVSENSEELINIFSDLLSDMNTTLSDFSWNHFTDYEKRNVVM